jgi:hypothetical protein
MQLPGRGPDLARPAAGNAKEGDMSTETLAFGPRRGAYADVSGMPLAAPPAAEREALDWLDALYRALCAILFNYVPTSGHPGGSVSSGRIAAGLLFAGLDYDVSRPEREDADVLSYAAGHKAMGLYALWALRDEIVRTGAPELLPTCGTGCGWRTSWASAATRSRRRPWRCARGPRPSTATRRRPSPS